MLARVFTLRFNPLVDGFDDGELSAFLRDREVVGVHDHFFARGGEPYLAVVVTYRAGRPEAEEPAAQGHGQAVKKRAEPGWRALLEEGDWPLFNALRDWRNDLAREEGVPAYVICTNKQLAAVAHGRPATVSALAQVEGIGPAKVKRYGEALLKLVGTTPGEEEGVAAEVDGGSAGQGMSESSRRPAGSDPAGPNAIEISENAAPPAEREQADVVAGSADPGAGATGEGTSHAPRRDG